MNSRRGKDLIRLTRVYALKALHNVATARRGRLAAARDRLGRSSREEAAITASIESPHQRLWRGARLSAVAETIDHTFFPACDKPLI